MQMLTVTPNEAGQRLDKLLGKYLSQAGKGFLYKMMRKKNITLNGKKCAGDERLKEGDEIRLFMTDETIEKFSGPVKAVQVPAKASGRKKKLDIIYEDEHILLVNKPAGMLSQKAKDSDVSLNEYILDYLMQSGRLTDSQLRTFRPSVCNRLDRNTSGLVTAGTSLAGLQVLNGIFKDRSLHKYYRCLVKGQMKERQLITGYLKKDERTNKVTVSPIEQKGSVPIATSYVPIGGNDRVTLLEVTLITGRSHQIRAHLASIGHPILGDAKYGDPAVNRIMKERYRISWQMLHSWKLEMPAELPEPLGYLAEKVFYAPVPDLFQKVMKGEGIGDS